MFFRSRVLELAIADLALRSMTIVDGNFSVARRLVVKDGESGPFALVLLITMIEVVRPTLDD